MAGAPPLSYLSGKENEWGTLSMSEPDMTAAVDAEDFTDELSDEALDRSEARACSVWMSDTSSG
jgi:hypothetical protein